jgi:hypothetical protein
MVETRHGCPDSPLNGKRKLDDASDSSIITQYLADEEKPGAASKRQRVIGPNDCDAHRGDGCTPSEDDDSSSDDDDFGPMPPPEHTGPDQETNSHIDPQLASNMPYLSSGDNLVHGNVNQRDEWMVLPPDKDSWTSSIDPTALRNRKFATGRSARTSRPDKNGPGPSWTESPAEKRMRLENEIMGIQAPSESDLQGSSGKPVREDGATAEKIRLFNVSISRQGYYYSITEAFE